MFRVRLDMDAARGASCALPAMFQDPQKGAAMTPAADRIQRNIFGAIAILAFLAAAAVLCGWW